MNTKELLYYNGFGGFSKEGNEYIIYTNEKRTPMPWSHILTNENFGTLITANGGGYIWSGNARENKITTWSNDPIEDKPSEKLCYEYKENNYNLLPYETLQEYIIKYGFGYATFIKENLEINSNVDIFVPINENKKIYIIKLKNKIKEEAEITIKYKIEPVLGVSREYTKKHLIITKKEDFVQINNYTRENYTDETIIISSSEKINNIEIQNKKVEIFFKTKLEPLEEKDLIIEIEAKKEKTNAESRLNLNENQSKKEIKTYIKKLEETKKYWQNFISKIKIKTPVESMNIIMNGWLLYQTVSSRIWARTSFYQSSGAFGFRDQLQDSLMLIYFAPEMAKKQIIYHAKHQFIEGDVLHWWHPENESGIRTRYKDDLLWLPYVLYEYVMKERDYKILDEKISYVKMDLLKENENEKYEKTTKEEIEESIYMHAKRAIEKSISFGEHGLPKMGSGDWNDGMNKVNGESVWLRIFFV